jgi:hypothetical protein
MMSDFDYDNNSLCPDSPRIHVPEATRVVLDLFNLPTGNLEHFEGPDGETSPETEDFLRRTLFPELPPLEDDVAPRVSTTTIGDETNFITISTTTRTTTTAPATAMMMEPTTTDEPQQQQPTCQVLVPSPPIHHLAAARPAPQRQRFTFSGKSFYAGFLIYLQNNPSLPPPASTPDLVGVVVKCPTKKNGQQYTIRWKYPLPQGTEWPDNLKLHLRTVFDKDYLHSSGLKHWILTCPLSTTNRDRRSALPTERRQQQEPAPANQPPAPANQPPPQVAPAADNNATTPADPSQQRMAFAALHTAGSASAAPGFSHDGISSLGHSNRSAFVLDVVVPPAAVTLTTPAPAAASTRSSTRSESVANNRARASGQYDSDDDNTLEEAEFQMNPSDGFWTPSAEEQNVLRLLRIQELSLDDDDDISPCPSPVFGTSFVNPSFSDLGTLIQECTDFQFEEIGTEALAAAIAAGHKAQPIYDGESGLRRGVAGSFRTPLEAFRKCGFSHDLVARYTQNSNK